MLLLSNLLRSDSRCNARVIQLENHNLWRGSLQATGLFPASAVKPHYLDRLFVKRDNGWIQLDTTGIIWLEAQGNYVRIHHERGRYLIRHTIARLGDQLNPLEFLRIRRSVIVQIDLIKELRPGGQRGLVVVMKDGAQFVLSRSYRSRLRRVLGAIKTEVNNRRRASGPGDREMKKLRD